MTETSINCKTVVVHVFLHNLKNKHINTNLLFITVLTKDTFSVSYAFVITYEKSENVVHLYS